MSFDILSVKEQCYQSDRITGRTKSKKFHGGILDVEITDRRDMAITFYHPDGRPLSSIKFDGVDIPGFIEFLKEAEAFVKESETFRTLVGNKK